MTCKSYSEPILLAGALFVFSVYAKSFCCIIAKMMPKWNNNTLNQVLVVSQCQNNQVRLAVEALLDAYVHSSEILMV